MKKKIKISFASTKGSWAKVKTERETKRLQTERDDEREEWNKRHTHKSLLAQQTELVAAKQRFQREAD